MPPLFTSSREKQLWLWAVAVIVAIFTTLFLGQPVINFLSNQDTQAIFFSMGLLLVGITIIIHAVKTKPGKTQLAVWLGVAAVYIMLFLRLGLTERSHLIEYSVLAIFIHKALSERLQSQNKIVKPALLAFILTFLIGVLDESIQQFVPNRVFDPLDILFNGIAVTMALGASLIIAWIRRLKNKT